MHDISILHQDEHVIAVNKPAGLAVIPERYQPDADCLVELLRKEWSELLVLHRVDKYTSGVVLFARTTDSHKHINQQFSDRQIKKKYLAIVCGQPSWQQTTLDQPLLTDADRQHRTRVNASKGKPAITEIDVLEQFSGYALVMAKPKTGRSHQIRAHLRSAGHVILGDDLYNAGVQPKPDWTLPGDAKPLINRMALHARAITFQHPATAETIHVEASYPQDFETAIERLQILSIDEHR